MTPGGCNGFTQPGPDRSGSFNSNQSQAVNSQTTDVTNVNDQNTETSGQAGSRSPVPQSQRGETSTSGEASTINGLPNNTSTSSTDQPTTTQSQPVTSQEPKGPTSPPQQDPDEIIFSGPD